MGKILIFVGTRAALEQYDSLGYPILTRILGEQNNKTVEAFNAAKEGVLVADYTMTHGWRVKADFVTFDKSWRWNMDNHMTIQASMRIAHPGMVTNDPNEIARMLGTIGVPKIKDRSSYDSHIEAKDGKFIWYDETGDKGGECDTREACYDAMDEYARLHLG